MITKAYWFQRAGKGVTIAFSAGAALVSFVSALYTYGVVGNTEAHMSIGNLGAAWVRMDPPIDTAGAIGDTVRFAATVADRSGSILLGARPTWTTGDTTIATVESDGAVIAKRPGQTTVTAIVGTFVATSHIVVRQKVAGVLISSSQGDAAVTLREGANLQLRARALDARGHSVMQAGAVWHVDDTTVAGLDSSGVLSGRTAGRSVVSASIGGRSAYLPVAVVTTPTALTVVAGASQRALAGRALPQPVVVRATNRRGEPAAGKAVTFRLSDGAGKTDPQVVLTDADGRARTTWTLADYPGRQTLLASVENLDSATAVVAESDPLPTNTRIVAAGEAPSALAGTALPDPVAVRVVDTSGRVLADVQVQWTALDGSSVEVIDSRSDSGGIARAQWTLGRKTGTQRLRAQIGTGAVGRGIPPVTLRATALAGSVTDVVIVGGDKQSGTVGRALAKPVVVRVVDANGNGVGNVPLVLSLSAGAVADSAPETDSLGIVRLRWTLGRAAGAHSLAVHVQGLKTLLKFTARAAPAAPANLAFEDAPAPRGTAAGTRRLHALVTDAYGNPVPDVTLTFTTASGTVTPARAVADARGRVVVTWKPATTSGSRVLRGAVRNTTVKGSYIANAAAGRSGAR